MKAPNHLQKRQLDLRNVKTAFDKNLKEVSSVNRFATLSRLIWTVLSVLLDTFNTDKGHFFHW